jgi:hypothetical protein
VPDTKQSPPTVPATTRRIASQAGGFAQESAKTAERVASRGLRYVKSRARQDDLVGQATQRALELAHSGLGGAVKGLSRLERAIEPEAHGAARRPAAKPATPRKRA